MTDCDHPRAAREGFRCICLVCGEIGGVKYTPNEAEREYWIDADGIAHKKDRGAAIEGLD